MASNASKFSEKVVILIMLSEIVREKQQPVILVSCSMEAFYGKMLKSKSWSAFGGSPPSLIVLCSLLPKSWEKHSKSNHFIMFSSSFHHWTPLLFPAAILARSSAYWKMECILFSFFEEIHCQININEEELHCQLVSWKQYFDSILTLSYVVWIDVDSQHCKPQDLTLVVIDWCSCTVQARNDH